MSQHYPAYLYTTPATPVVPSPFNPTPYYPQYTHIALQPQLSTRSTSPEPAPISPDVASQTVQRMMAAELKEAGFNSATDHALRRLELEVVAFVEYLYKQAHDYANLANRAGPIATDLLQALQETKFSTKDLRATAVKAKKRRKKAMYPLRAPRLERLRESLPLPDRLPSDDEGPSVLNMPVSLRTLPQQVPALPPKHTYQHTPASPPKRAALPSLEKKLKTASMVQASLENLLLATEDSSTQKDAELLGHIVNWEINVHPRKNWAVRQASSSPTALLAEQGGASSVSTTFVSPGQS